MRIAVTGSSGLIGTALCAKLLKEECSVLRLVRSNPLDEKSARLWNPSAGVLKAEDLESLDAVIHLAGRNIAAGRWSKKEKERIYNSRIQSTVLLRDALLKLKNPPSLLISASAVGYYGDRGSELVAEDTAPGDDFLANVCKDWEAAAGGLEEKGIRLAILRAGVVLSTDGGALKKMLLPFKLGLGGAIGSGEQYMSWISLRDAVEAIWYIIKDSRLCGPINLCAPNPVTNREFTKTLGGVLGRPTLLPVPALIARLALGEMADALLLTSIRAEPKQLASAGYTFQHNTLKEALCSLLKGTSRM